MENSAKYQLLCVQLPVFILLQTSAVGTGYSSENLNVDDKLLCLLNSAVIETVFWNKLIGNGT